MEEFIQEFIEDWERIRGRTLEFLEKIPEEKFTWKPHEFLGSFGMQVRHMSVSQRAYIDGMVSGRIDFSNKSYDERIETNKTLAIQALKDLDKALKNLLKKIDPNKEISFIDGVEGTSEVTLEEALSYLIDHEYYHQGIFTCYGRLAGMGKFLFM